MKCLSFYLLKDSFVLKEENIKYARISIPCCRSVSAAI